jgi:transposase
LSAQRIYQDLVDEHGFSDSYESVKQFVRKLRALHPERIYRLECQPGEEVQVDFGRGAPIEELPGKTRRSWLLRMVLSYSRKGYSEAVLRQDTETFLRCLENGLRSFGGCPLLLNLDNLKAAVLEANWFDPEINPKLADFCRHYGLHVAPCRPGKPQHKGKVESGVGYVRSNALKGRRFRTLNQKKVNDRNSTLRGKGLLILDRTYSTVAPRESLLHATAPCDPRGFAGRRRACKTHCKTQGRCDAPANRWSR